MAIIQISKIQVRSGNLVDLPQLDDGELGWATDNRRLFVGRTGANIVTENVEVLTSYSNVYFSQINGAIGNLNMNNVQNGQLLTYVSSTETWENYSGANTVQLNGSKLQLGNVECLTIGGGAIGYVLQTDGIGNLSWTPKGALYTPIKALSNATPIIMTVANTVPYTNGTLVTISGANGANANTIVNGKSFYVKLAVDYPTSGNVALYTDTGLTANSVGTNLGVSTPNVAIATSVVGSAGGGSGAAGGSSTTVQFNSGGVLTGNSNFTFNYLTSTLTISSGNVITGNVAASSSITAPAIISNVATGTAPFTVSSTTRVANLNVATSGVANTVNDAAQPNITSIGTLSSISVSGNANIGNIGTALITATGNVTGANLVTGGIVTATGNVTGANLVTGGIVTATGNIRGGNLTTGGVISATGNANVGNIGATAGVFTTVAGSLTTNAQPNITSTGILASLSVSGNANIGNIGTGLVSATGNATVLGIKTDNYYYANGVAISFAGAYSNSNVASYLPTYTGNLAGGNLILANSALLTVGSNTNTGTITGNWTLSTGSKLQATYADLAEYYEADQEYEPGTILMFGGDKEVTIAEDATTRVAGVVSTNPAYVMNAGCAGLSVAVALQGRVPTKVRGLIRKGDMMVSGGNGFARPSLSPQMGTVIGKALEDFDGIEGVIEVAVGRL